MIKDNQEKENETLFLRFSGDLLPLADWIESQSKLMGFRNRQDFVLSILREARINSKKETVVAA